MSKRIDDSNKKEQKVQIADASVSSKELGIRRRRNIGLLSLISMVLVIAAVIAANYFIDYVADRYVLEIDMTSDSEYEISEETVQLLETLSEPIQITVLCDETDYQNDADLRRLPKVFQRYEQLSGGTVSVRYINAVANPGIFNDYNALGDLSTADIIVESAKRYKSMSPYDLLEYQTKQNQSKQASEETKYATGLRAEQRLTSAILYVTATKIPKAAYTTGHQETTNLEQMDALLTSGNYDVTTVSLMSEGEVPSDIDMLIISQPKGDFTSDEINALEDFMDNGGKMIVTYASDTPKLQNLEEYFAEWGIEYENQLIVDNERCYAGYPMYLLPNINTVEGITNNLNPKSYAIVPGARPVKTLWSEDNWRGTQVLLTTSNNAYAKDLTEASSQIEQDENDANGPFNVGVLSYQAEMHNLNSTYSYILFLNAGFVSDTTLESSTFLNKDYFLAALNFMSDDSEAVVIDSKDLTATELVVPGSAKRVLFYLLILMIPCVCLGLGIGVWAKRRHK